ncbi:hypothetical protein N7457_002291 [Penicillium paradoxum]|uniref:uncharacterized protein n=1 Tax=Penicillium paradoxum TaxID=176176 RepID=UPI002546C086|nr:uncharacterized protein N7457_002291 [Penicillium paradoxum]KAJ5787301.1 hypothetical protein N7457_002291 [Penicillium paradoxum]
MPALSPEILHGNQANELYSTPMETPYQSGEQSKSSSGKESPPVDKPTSKRRHSRATATYPRKRATQACHTCRHRRTKCDNTRPSCASCLRLGAECSYEQISFASFDPASLAILKRLDDLESLLRKATDPLPGALAHVPHSVSPSMPFGEVSPVEIDHQTQWKPSFINIEEVLKWPVFDEQEIAQRLHLLSLSEEETFQPDLPISVDLDLYAADHLVRTFFNDVHIFNPTLKEENIRECMEVVRLNGIGWDAMSCLLSSGFLQAEAYFLAAQKRMGMLLCKSGPVEAQCFFLAGVYLMTTLRPVGAWRMFVQALACCQGFSAHTMSDNRYEDTWETRQRIYWTCFKSELELRLELNRSQKSVVDLSYPTGFPSPPEELKSKDEAAWYFYLAEIALRRLENRILDYAYRPGLINLETDVILDFEDQANAWLRSLPEALAFDTENPDADQYAPFRFILSGHFIDCQETMYWHFLVDAIHGRMDGSSEVLVRKGLKVCVDRIQQNRTGFYHRHHGTWLMLRSCTRSASVLLAAERSIGIASFLPNGWEEAIFEVSRVLTFWKDESHDVLGLFTILQTLIEARAFKLT